MYKNLDRHHLIVLLCLLWLLQWFLRGKTLKQTANLLKIHTNYLQWCNHKHYDRCIKCMRTLDAVHEKPDKI